MNFNKIQPLPVVCRQSCINCAIECERRWFYQYRMGVRLRGTQYKEAATLGKIYHQLQLVGSGNEQEVKVWIRGQQQALMVRVDAGEDLDGEMSRLANNLTSLYHKAEVMAHIFWEKFPQPKYLETIAKEVTHSVTLTGIKPVPVGLNNLVLEGTIDKLQLNKKSDEGDVWIRDHKSTGRPLAVIFGGLAWSSQARIYRVLAEDYCREHQLGQYTGSYTVRGFILDGIIKPGIKLCRTDDKNAKDWNCSVEDAYLRRVKEWYKDYEVRADLKGQDSLKAIDSKGIYFTEPLFPPELLKILERMKELSTHSIHPDYFSRDITRQACFSYEKRCIYHPLCDTDPKQWDQLFETKYRLVTEIEAKEDRENL